MSDRNKTNYQIAKEEADRIDALIIDTLQQGKSFRVEAGAGSGKTYSLNKVIEWIQANKWHEYNKKKQTVVCITYTNAAVDVISERLAKNTFILPSTIHSFAWSVIKQYQSTLISIINENEQLWAKETDFSEVAAVHYELGHRYVRNGTHYLFHDDVIKLFVAMLENAKFRKIFRDKYPLILIDEYQDSFAPIIDCFIKYFIAPGVGPQFGFFGDSWQTIYQSNNVCGTIDHPEIVEIKKVSNFRSAPKIVSLLNYIRPELPQVSAEDDFQGEAYVITCDDFQGERRQEKNFKGDLPAHELKERLNSLSQSIQESYPGESIKTLMITHKVLATQQGYERLLEIIDNGLRDKEDVFLLFFMNTVEPIFQALTDKNMQLLFDTLKLKRYPINNKAEKQQWKDLENNLRQARTEKTVDVVKAVIESKLVPVEQPIRAYYNEYFNTPELQYSGTTIKEFLDLEYSQFISAIQFLQPEAKYSTEHGVKGEEYDNVIFAISKGWNQYQFETYAPMIRGTVPNGKEAAFIRNRNLFYVCCSRPKKRLFFFVSVPIDQAFRCFLINLVGEENMLTYSEYMEKLRNQ